MATITLPVWALAATVGLPGTCLIWLVAVLMRRRSKARRAVVARQMEFQAPDGGNGLNHFRDDLLAQQIDIIFNGLTALIETERVKLRSLFSQGLVQPCQFQPAPAPAALDQPEMEDATAHDPDPSPIGQKVAEAMAAGQATEDIATQLGLSHAEVALAMKLHQTQSASPYRKLEAVA